MVEDRLERMFAMKVLTDIEVKRSISKVKATLAVEGLNMNYRAIKNGSEFLKGKISSKQAIDNITNYILSKK